MVSAASQVDSGQLQLMGAPGFRFLKDLWPGFRSGGLAYYPYSSIKSGLGASWTLAAANPSASAAAVTVAVAAGNALIDAQDAILASGINVTFTPENIQNGENFFRIFAAPTRVLQPVLANNGVYTAPTTRLNGDPIDEGDRYAECAFYPEHLETLQFYKFVNGVWTLVDMSFESEAGTQEGYNRTLGGACHRKITASNFMVNAIEVPIYVGAKYPVSSYRPAQARLRAAASLEIATAKLYYHVLPLSVTATFTNGSDEVTLDYANRSVFNDIVNSIVATTTLEIDGAALAADGYAASTGVITLGANYAGTTGTKQVLITPVTEANIYVRSLAKSELIPSGNLTNP